MIKYDDNYIKNRNSFPLATYTCKYVNCFDRESVTIHYHKDFEILYIDKGFADVQISGKNYSVGSGTLILINPFEPHSIIVRSPNYSHRCICFDIGLLDLKNEEEILSGELSYKNIILNSASLLPYFDLSYKSEKEKQDGWELRSQGSLMLMFSLLSECVEKSKSLKEQKFAKKILEILETDFQNDITSAEIAERFSYNHSYFCRLFKRIFNYSFGDYLNIFRITKAKEFLNDYSVSETAILSGFASLSYFSRTFKKITGITPIQYKNNPK